MNGDTRVAALHKRGVHGFGFGRATDVTGAFALRVGGAFGDLHAEAATARASEQRRSLSLGGMHAALPLGILPVGLPAVLLGLFVAEGAAILSSRDACLRFLRGLASLDVGEVSSVCGPVGASEVARLHRNMFGTDEDVSLRTVSADFRIVLGVRARHVISVEEGSRGATRLDDASTEVQVRLTSVGWRIERFCPLTGGRWEHTCLPEP